MNRSATNAIRFCIDELIPPIIRDARWFMFPFYWFAYRGKLVREAMEFKSRIATMTPEEYVHFYECIDTISRNRESDLNNRCLKAILDALPGGQVRILDAGCGNGFLLRAIGERNPKAVLYGLDLKAPREPIPGEFTRGVRGGNSISRQGVRPGDLHPYIGTLPAPGKSRARAHAGRAKRADHRRAEATALLLYRGRARAVLLLPRAADNRRGTCKV